MHWGSHGDEKKAKWSKCRIRKSWLKSSTSCSFSKNLFDDTKGNLQHLLGKPKTQQKCWRYIIVRGKQCQLLTSLTYSSHLNTIERLLAFAKAHFRKRCIIQCDFDSQASIKRLFGSVFTQPQKLVVRRKFFHTKSYESRYFVNLSLLAHSLILSILVC